jgi:hypothetical protein
MTISQNIILNSCDRDAARMDAYLPGTRKEVIASNVDGQSQAQGGHGANTDPITFTSGSAYATDGDNTVLILRELTVNASGTGPDRIGSTSSIYGFAAELWDNYAIRSVISMAAWQGTALLDATPNGADPAYRWDSATDELSLTKSSLMLGPQIRNRIVPHLFECLRLRPDLKVVLNVCHWAHGEAEAPHLLSGTVTTAQYTAGLQSHWDYRKSEGFELMVVHEHGRKGLDGTEVTANEPMNILVREAQANFVAANADVIWGSQASKETSVLTVDANGVWVSGFDYFTDDGGVHWTGPAQNAIGRLAAERVAAHESIPAVIDLTVYEENGLMPELVVDLANDIYVLDGELVSQADVGTFTGGTWPFVIPTANVPDAVGGFSASIAGRVTYADTNKGLTLDGAIAEVVFARRFQDVSNYWMLALQTNSTNTGQVVCLQEAAGVWDFASSTAQYTPATLVPFNVAMYVTAAAVGGAKDGVANVEDTGNTVVVNVDTSDVEIGSNFTGEVDLVRIWGSSIGSVGAVSATA